MRNVSAALKTFFNGFGLPAYTVDTVPDDISLPYIGYSVSEPEWNQKATLYAQVWYRSRSNTEILEKADEITGAIGTGLIINIEGGYIVLWPETPLVQVIVDGDNRSAYINLSINAYHLPGN